MVFSRLRQAIVDGEFALGENISEEKLAEALGVSRTPVRDALAQLQLIGLVNVRPKRGTFVFEPTERDIIAICDFRYMLEVHAVKLSLQRDAGGFLDALKDVLVEMEQVMEGNDPVSYGRIDTRFHRTFFDWCDNSYVQDSFRLAEGRVAALRTILTSPLQERRHESFQEHHTMVELMAREDFTTLEKVFQTHIDRTLSVHLDALRSGVIGTTVHKQPEFSL